MLTLARNTKAVARRASFFSLAMAALILAPIACSSGASAGESGNGGGGGGGGAGGGGDNGGGNSLNYGNFPDVAITAAPSGNQRQGHGRGMPVTKAGACIGDKLSCNALRS